MLLDGNVLTCDNVYVSADKISHDSEVPAHGQQAIVVCAVIVHYLAGVPHVLVPRRAETKRFMPSVFELPGGHVDFGEDLVPALRREVTEELGLDIVVGELLDAFSYMNEIKGSHSVELIYAARKADPDAEPTLHPADHSEYRWLSLANLADMLVFGKTDTDREYLTIEAFLSRTADLLEPHG